MIHDTRRVLVVLALSALVVGGAACGSASGRPEGAPEPASAQDAEAISAFQPVADILASTCATAACHSAARGAGQLVLSPDVARGNLVDAPSNQQSGATLVVPGEPEQSYLLSKVRGAEGIRGARMPIGGAPLTAEQERAIVDWIGAGAPE